MSSYSRFVLIGVAVGVFSCSRPSSSAATRFEDPVHHVAVMVPAGFTRVEDTKAVAKFAGPSRHSFIPKLLVTVDKFSQPLDEYIKAAIESLASTHKSYFELDRSEFVTATRVKGIRVTLEGAPTGPVVVQRCYFIDGGAKKITLILSRAGDPDPEFDALSDKCAQSLEFIAE